MSATHVPNKYLTRFWDFVARDSFLDCWRWLGATKPDGCALQAGTYNADDYCAPF